MSHEFIYPVKAHLNGKLMQRIERSWERLHQKDYQLGNIFKPLDYAWPGDYEGRALLALSKLMAVTGRNSPTVEGMKEQYSCYCNPSGYLGPVNEQIIDEQQLAGHGWVLRSLSEMELLQPDEVWRKLAVNMVEAFKKMLSNRLLATYPIYDGQRQQAGKVDGLRDKRIGSWQLSTDVGAVFILFDGLVQASQVFKLDCRELLEEFYQLAQRLDVLAVKAQTHATLTLCRGLLRFSQYCQCNDAVQLAEKLYKLYRQRGMTLNYANYNWFDRPEWTEPCAIVDSFMVAMELFRRSGDAEYLDDAHRIWFSGVERSQRQSGGFGGESCLSAVEDKLFMKFYEAPNCCNMRGAEGLYECAMRSLWRTAENELIIALPIPGVFTFADGLSVEITTTYPTGGSLQLKVQVPDGQNEPQCKIFRVNENWSPESVPGDYPIQQRPLPDGKNCTLFQGPIMLGQDAQGLLHRVNEFDRLPLEEAQDFVLKCIFDLKKQ